MTIAIEEGWSAMDRVVSKAVDGIPVTSTDIGQAAYYCRQLLVQKPKLWNDIEELLYKRYIQLVELIIETVFVKQKSDFMTKWRRWRKIRKVLEHVFLPLQMYYLTDMQYPSLRKVGNMKLRYLVFNL